MTNAEFQLLGVSDPRLAALAASALPAWLWSADGTRIWWANPAGAATFGAASVAALAERAFGPADPHRRQVAQLAGQLLPNGAPRLERLQGFGTPLGGLVTCGCARLTFWDGRAGILVTAIGPRRPAPALADRLRQLVDGIDSPAAAFTDDGDVVAMNAAASAVADARDLVAGSFDDARIKALQSGRAACATAAGEIALYRVGSGDDAGLVGLVTPAPARAQDRDRAPAAATPLDTAAAAASAEPDGADAFDIDLITPPPAPDADTVRHLPDEAPTTIPQAPADAAPATGDVDDLEEDAAPEAVMTPYVAAPDAGFDEATLQSDSGSARHACSAQEAAVAVRPFERPLRFTWQMDADSSFLLRAGEFTRLIGPRTAAAFGRPWPEINAALALDPEDRIAAATATHDTWSGITLHWPADGDSTRLPVELSGLPVFDRDRNFAGYRGFGVCRDLDALTRLAARRHDESSGGEARPQAPQADVPRPQAGDVASFVSTQTVDTPQNVVPLRPSSDPQSPALTPVENSAFNELARQLTERLELDDGDEARPPPASAETDDETAWLAVNDVAAQGLSGRDTALLDLVPAGVLVYRLEQLLYANAAFARRMGFAGIDDLRAAGGLDTILIAPRTDMEGETANGATRVAISADATGASVEAGLFTVTWDGETALALILSPATETPSAPPQAGRTAGAANADELGAIIDTMAEGVLMFDGDGRISACNRGAEALFGYDGSDLVARQLRDLLAPESEQGAADYLAAVKDADAASLLDHGREVLGRVRDGSLLPLSMILGRTAPDSPNFFAVFRDLSQVKKTELELRQARRQSERGAAAKADVLARISHEIRTPLNAIIGFADVMIDERFGALGNERYADYLKDIRASGERVIAIVDEMLDLSRIETGKVDLAFADQDLNDLIEQCVAVLQPRANRERIIIRTSLGHALPPVVADARALRQIALNLIGSSIHLANAGGQVIVSTALSDSGDVVLRVRDTGQGLNDSELAAALEPFGASPPPERTPDHSGMSLSLAKALVEANRARFQIKSAPHSGTLIEVTFARVAARA